jgi:hypothetical protein
VTVRRWVAGCALAACVVASCGDDALAPRAARDLAADYELVATAVENGDRTEARRSVRTLVRSVHELEAAGVIDAERAEAIRSAVEHVLADLRLLPAPSPSPSPSIEPSPPAPTVEPDTTEDGDADAEGDENGRGGWSDGGPGNSDGKGNGKSHGHAKGHDKR